jgi:hypothetical protein
MKHIHIIAVGNEKLLPVIMEINKINSHILWHLPWSLKIFWYLDLYDEETDSLYIIDALIEVN